MSTDIKTETRGSETPEVSKDSDSLTNTRDETTRADRPRSFDLFDDRRKKAACFRLVDHEDLLAQVVADIYRNDIAKLLQAAPKLLTALERIASSTVASVGTEKFANRAWEIANEAIFDLV